MSRNIRRLATIVMLGFAVLVGFLTYWQVIAADELRGKMPFDAARVQAAEERVTRGAILDRNGQRLAWTEATPDGPRRVYAHPGLVHVLGYYSFRYGTWNIEREFDSYLAAAKGLSPLALLRKEFLYEPVQGADVVTTIDVELQKVADEALGDRAGAIVALDPRTGELLALASHPFFDPNRVEEDWEELIDDPHKPLFNRAASGQYVPGSTYKLITLATALEAGVVSPQTTFKNAGEIVVNGFRIKYTNPPNRQTFDLRDAFAFSVNAAFAEIGLKLGAERLVEGATRFGFGEAPPLEGIPTAESRLSSSEGFLRGRPALASTAFGQGELSVSPLTMALAVAAVANGGVVPDPYVVAEVRDAQGNVLLRNEPRPWKVAMSPETARIIDGMMVYSVEAGFAQPARISGVKVAGKTGTAEVGDGAEPHAWFIGYAPADDPAIAVAVIRENAGQGSQEATPQARRVIQAWLSRR